MEVGLTSEQLDLQQSARSFCDKRYPLDRLGELERAPLTRADWAELASLGVFRLHASSAAGGLELGVVDSAIVFEVLGHALVPGPLVWTALAGTHLPDIATDAIVGGVVEPAPADTAPAGTSTVVEFADQLDLLVVLRPDGVHVVERDDLDAEPATPLDPLTPVGVVRRVPVGARVAGPDVAARLRLEGTALTAALLLGIADRALASATSYASSRQQFGRAIGSFQAIKHMAADMYVRTSIARSATYAAAALIDDPEAGDPDTASAAAMVVAADAALRNARACIQVHGGMGFTWEMIPNYLLKRTWVLAQSFGTQAEHEERIAAGLASEVTLASEMAASEVTA